MNRCSSPWRLLPQSYCLVVFFPFLHCNGAPSRIDKCTRPNLHSQNLKVQPIFNCSSESSPSSLTRKAFPAGFVFGTATSAYQVEGAANQDGRGRSIWDSFSHRIGNIIDLSNGDITDDHYNRFKGTVNMYYPGIDHYNAVIDALLSKGIEPYVTLYHWDLPQALQDEYGGWLSENIIDDFLSFADTCFASFGDRVKHWITINEPYNFVSQGYGGFGTQAPGRCSIRVKCSEGDSKIEPYIAGHNALMAHISVVALYREKYQAQQRGSIGICLDSRWYEPLNETSMDDLEASGRALDFHLGWFLGPLVFGDYPSSMRTLVRDSLPSFQNRIPGRRVWVNGSFDFIGLNHYTTTYVQAGRPSYVSASFSSINPDGRFEVSCTFVILY
ncbi:hypothetical protein KP509_04G063900 [Ceratopteris richardii]|uniref:Uncharacterized protein n=1 Tax=Ceratopteris richardii TaxID=49495 RepID=A0A8T2V139_CERRI|nr:hypothetical protein KP509_04G063900 [Ceratopteris richardii]